ncbi:hypothetical protein KAX17_10335 [Candidatus Bipolaricaulota bacterium]|nr:hypothetical protein [Candidatus Bipolaricaulota bacterium]
MFDESQKQKLGTSEDSKQDNDRYDKPIEIKKILAAAPLDIQISLSPCPLVSREPADKLAEAWNSESRT